MMTLTDELLESIADEYLSISENLKMNMNFIQYLEFKLNIIGG